MNSKPKRQKYYTFMVIPHDANGRTISIKIPSWVIHATLSVAAFSIIVVGSSLIYSTILSRKLVHYADTLVKNKEQKQVISSFSVKAKEVKRAISDLEKSDNELRKQLGLKSRANKLGASPATKESTSLLDIKTVKVQLEERRESLTELKAWVSEVRQKLAATPSRWPIYGQLVSYFGYRSYPWRGFHAGLDIKGGYGSPVRTTADGVVSFTGWRRGYGKTVIVDHGSGITTLYAHNSGYAVGVGQKVRRGQVVSYIGTTGYSTGPHLHYEVRKWDVPVNPVAYLNMNILSASKLWSKWSN